LREDGRRGDYLPTFPVERFQKSKQILLRLLIHVKRCQASVMLRILDSGGGCDFRSGLPDMEHLYGPLKPDVSRYLMRRLRTVKEEIREAIWENRGSRQNSP
jgi:hypothetical protein